MGLILRAGLIQYRLCKSRRARYINHFTTIFYIREFELWGSHKLIFETFLIEKKCRMANL